MSLCSPPPRSGSQRTGQRCTLTPCRRRLAANSRSQPPPLTTAATAPTAARNRPAPAAHRQPTCTGWCKQRHVLRVRCTTGEPARLTRRSLDAEPDGHTRLRLPATARFVNCKHHTLCSPSDVLAHPPPTGRVARRSHVAALAPVGASRWTVLSRSCPTHHTGASQQQHTPACHVRHQRRRTNTAAGQRCAAHPSKHRLYEPQPLSAVVHALARGIVDSPQKFEKTAKSDSPESSDEPDTAVVSSLRVVRAAAIEFWRCVAPTSHSVVVASVACWCGVARASWAMKSMQMIVVNICDMMPSRGRAGACGRNSSKKKKKQKSSFEPPTRRVLKN